MKSYHKRHSDYLKHKGMLLVFSSPSGAGKTTLTRSLLASDRYVKLSVSATTRQPRPGELEGKHYYFLDEASFKTKEQAGEFYEVAKVFKNYYGTLKEPVQNDLENGYDVLLDIDWQGAQTLMQDDADKVVSIFIMPPSLDVLHDRLNKRQQDSKEEVEYRMSLALEEMKHWPEYDYVVVNDDLEKASHDVRSILRSERLKRRRQIGLTQFVHSFMENEF